MKIYYMRRYYILSLTCFRTMNRNVSDPDSQNPDSGQGFFSPKTFLDLHEGLQEKPPALQRVLFSMKLLKTDSNPDPGSLAQLNLDPDLNNKFQVFAAFRPYHFFALRNHIVYIQYTFAM